MAWLGGNPVKEAPGSALPAGSSAQWPLTTPGGAKGQWFSGTAGTFGHPNPAQIPNNIDAIRGAVGQYRNLPGGFGSQPFKSLPGSYAPPPSPAGSPDFQTPNEYMKYWQGVQAPIPDFNMGPHVASNEPECMHEGFSGRSSMAEEQGMYGA